VRDKPTERYTTAWLSRTGCAPTDKPARQADGAVTKAGAQRGPALSPQRHGALRSAWNYPLCSGGGCQATTCLERSGLSLRNAASSSGHSLWVTFLLGQQEKSDSSGGSRSKRPPRRRHAGRMATIEAQSHWIPAFAGMTSLRVLRRDDGKEETFPRAPAPHPGPLPAEEKEKCSATRYSTSQVPAPAPQERRVKTKHTAISNGADTLIPNLKTLRQPPHPFINLRQIRPTIPKQQPTP
jgi:hypothetical protein